MWSDVIRCGPMRSDAVISHAPALAERDSKPRTRLTLTLTETNNSGDLTDMYPVLYRNFCAEISETASKNNQRFRLAKVKVTNLKKN